MMTDRDKAIFEIIKTSLWGGEALHYVDIEGLMEELTFQAVEGIAAEAISNNSDTKDYRFSRFVQMLYTQNVVINTLVQAEIDVVVLKGAAAGIYYPVPYLRRYGDIDLLVQPSDYRKSINVINSLDGERIFQTEEDVSDFCINGFSIDLHRSVRGVERSNEGTYISNYIMQGFSDIQWCSFNQPSYSFPMLPWKQNGLELIWHIRVHLYNGLGLRQIIDWMMFVHNCLTCEAETDDFLNVLNNAGLLRLAKVVTRMCQLYLGLDESITWCSDVDVELCENLMKYILEQGNFGTKSNDDKAVKVLTKYRNPISFLFGMQRRGVREWSLARKHIFIRPFAWGYVLIKGILRYTNNPERARLRRDLEEKRKRIELFNQLYEEK